MRTKEQIEKEIEALQEELKQLDKFKFERVINGQTYHIIGGLGGVHKIMETNSTDDTTYFENYNYFLTKEHAEKVANKQRILRFMEKWNYEFDNGYEFIKNIPNYSINYTYRYGIYHVIFDKVNKQLGLTYFSSEEKAKQCLEDMKKVGLL